jgi:hypothetical protein
VSASISLPERLPIAQKSGRERVRASFLATISPTKSEQTYVWQEYVNRETGRRYDYHHYDPRVNQLGRLRCDGTDEGCENPHHLAEKMFVYSDGPKYALAKGGEGGGKSVAGIIKDLERLRRGMTGIMVSPDFEHFKKSLWAEFRRWCPPEAVLERERYRLRVDWEPSKQFELHFHNAYGTLTTLYCGGMDDETGWEGPNVHWAHGDEVRRKNYATGEALIVTVLAGRVRMRGPKGEPPQLWFTTTPKMHWLYDYFGGVPDHFGNLDPGQEHYKPEDPMALFKKKAVVISLYTEDNIAYLDDDYVEDRGAAFTSDAARNVHLRAAWEDVGDISHFLEDMTLWDACEEAEGEELGELGRNEPVVLAIDGAYASKGDVFAAVAAQKHPVYGEDGWVAIRAQLTWEAQGKPRDFDSIEDDIKIFCLDHAVQEIAYDPRELHHMMGRLRKRSKCSDGRWFPGIMCTEFPQGVLRQKADKNWFDLIVSRKATHSGHPVLRKHVANSDKDTNKNGKGIRIVKRQRNLKIDLNVCASMAAYKAEGIIEKRPRAGTISSGTFGRGVVPRTGARRAA